MVPGEMVQFDERAYLSNGLVQPPTSWPWGPFFGSWDRIWVGTPGGWNAYYVFSFSVFAVCSYSFNGGGLTTFSEDIKNLFIFIHLSSSRLLSYQRFFPLILRWKELCFDRQPFAETAHRDTSIETVLFPVWSDLFVPWKDVYLSNEKPWLFRVYRGWTTTQLCGDHFINPGIRILLKQQVTSISWKVRPGFWVVVQTFVIIIPIWGRFPFWLIFFSWVETTNQVFSWLTCKYSRCISGSWTKAPIINLLI